MGKSCEQLTTRTLAWLTFACGIAATILILGEELDAFLPLIGVAIGVVRYRKRLQEDHSASTNSD